MKDIAKKLAQCESDLEKAEERADVGETKIIELEEELKVGTRVSQKNFFLFCNFFGPELPNGV